VSTVGVGGRTLVDKIWDQHVVAELGDGLDVLHVDRHLVHDVTSPQAFTTLAERSVEVLSPELTFGSPEHSVTILSGRTEESNDMSRTFVPLLRRNFAAHGLRLFDIDSPDHGIVHVIGPELGLTLPGATVVCGDSHTCTNGGLGALGFGVGTSELTLVLATQSLVQRRPKMMRITFAGALAPGVEPKDLMLDAIARLGADAGAGYAIEFAGPAIVALGVEQRMTVCNLAVELGAKIGLVAPDDVTFDYVATGGLPRRERCSTAAIAHWRGLVSDLDADFDREVELDAAAVAPQITWGTSPAHSIAVDAAVPDPAGAPDETTARQWEQAQAYMDLQPGQGPRGPAGRVGLHRLVHERAALGSRSRGRGGPWSESVPPRAGPGRAGLSRREAGGREQGPRPGLHRRRLRVGRAGVRALPRPRRRHPGAGRPVRLHLEPELRGSPGHRGADPPGGGGHRGPVRH
jgi:3-isopropylmalate/(R)-2-methylmalate dehydratase large subunit